MTQKEQGKTPNISDRPLERHPTGNPESSSSSSARGRRYHFRCADTGMFCNFETYAYSEEEIMQRAHEHGREAHNILAIDEKTKRRIREAVQSRAA